MNNDKSSCTGEAGCYWCEYLGEGFCFSSPCDGSGKHFYKDVVKRLRSSKN
jgi:hypothetical protein